MDDIERLKAEAEAQKQRLLQLSVEYTLMGKECEREKMYEAAIANYKKALDLYPEAQDPKRRIEKIRKKLGKENF